MSDFNPNFLKRLVLGCYLSRRPKHTNPRRDIWNVHQPNGMVYARLDSYTAIEMLNQGIIEAVDQPNILGEQTYRLTEFGMRYARA